MAYKPVGADENGNLPPRVAAKIAADRAAAIAEEEFVSTTALVEDSAEFANADDSTLFAVDDIKGIPYLRGADAPVNVTGAPDDSFEMVDGNNIVIFAVDSLRSNPRFRGATVAPTFTETHLIITAGQSNSVGIGSTVPVGTNDPLPNLFTIPQRGAQSGQIVDAVEPLAHPLNDPVADTRGHAVRFGQLYAAANPGIRVVIVPVAASGTGFRRVDSPYSWAPAREGEAGITSLYRSAIVKATAAAALFTGTVRTAAILWHQGEADAVATTTSAQYTTDLDALIAGFRAEMPNATTAAFVVGQMLHEFITVRAEGTVNDINAVHVGTPARVTRTGYAANPGPGYGMVDNTHYTGKGQWLLAANMWTAYDRALYNV